jgi:hypothetical protein
VAQSHTPCNRCVRFATTVASGHATLATKRTLLLTWTGLAPAGSHQLCLAVAVGTLIAERPPHRSVLAAFPHTDPTSGIGRQSACRAKDGEYAAWEARHQSALQMLIPVPYARGSLIQTAEQPVIRAACLRIVHDRSGHSHRGEVAHCAIGIASPSAEPTMQFC